MKLVKPMAMYSFLEQSGAGDGRLVSSNIPEDDLLYWSDSTTYSTGDKVLVTGYRSIYESKADSNLDYFPPDNPDWWEDVGASNQYALFDRRSNTKSVSGEAAGIVVTVDPQESGSYNQEIAINSVTFHSVYASAARVKLTDDVEGVVYDKTIDLVDLSGIDDFWAWAFDPIAYRDTVVFSDIPPYFGGVFELTLYPIGVSGDYTEVGEIDIGQAVGIGVNEMGSSASIADYSKKTINAITGAVEIEAKNSAKTADYRIRIDSDRINYARSLLNEYISTAVTFIGDGVDTEETPDDMVIFGFYRNFSAPRDSKATSLISLRIEELSK